MCSIWYASNHHYYSEGSNSCRDMSFERFLLAWFMFQFTPQGVAHKCICPSWADTEIVSGAKTTVEEKEGLDKSIKVRK